MNKTLIAASMAVAFAFTVAPAMAESDGEGIFMSKCKSCHKPPADNKNSTGPTLNGVCGRALESAVDKDGKAAKYGSKYKAYAKDHADFTWTKENLDTWLTKPNDMIKGTAMKFGGLDNKDDREAVIKFLGCE